MSFPVKELKVTLDDFFGPFMEKKLNIISARIADDLIREFRNRLLTAIKKEVETIQVKNVEKDKQLKVVIEDKRSL